MLSKNLIADVLTQALSKGGDFAEVFVENTYCNSVNMVNGVVEKAVSGVDYGAGLRIFVGNNAIYLYTNDTSHDNFMKIATQASELVSLGSSTSIVGFTDKNVNNIHTVSIMPDTVLKKDIVEMLKYGHNEAKGYSSLITQTSGTYADSSQNILIANSEGLWVEDTRVRTRIALSSVASNETEKQTGSKSPGSARGYEHVKALDIKELAIEGAKGAVTMLKADESPSGKMPVVIDNGFGGVIFHEACGHSLEATSVAHGASVFCGKLGERIASDVVTAVDDGTIANEFGSANIDDEGEDCRRNVLIENGILKSYLVDKLNGKKMGMKSTGSGRRESYRYAPTSRMTNTFIAPGKNTRDEIISSVDLGIYAKAMGGGSVTPATGEFNFAVLEGYMIRNGKIAEPIRGATLIGKGSEVLMDIDMVSSDMEMAQGMCGSASGAIPVNVGQPMIRVKELTVGGKKA